MLLLGFVPLLWIVNSSIRRQLPDGGKQQLNADRLRHRRLIIGHFKRKSPDSMGPIFRQTSSRSRSSRYPPLVTHQSLRNCAPTQTRIRLYSFGNGFETLSGIAERPAPALGFQAVQCLETVRLLFGFMRGYSRAIAHKKAPMKGRSGAHLLKTQEVASMQCRRFAALLKNGAA